MELAEPLGWLAVLFTLTAFSMRTMLPLRAAAIGANFCFIGFGYLEDALPILTLHAILLPCNVMRLRQIVLAQREADRNSASALQVERLSPFRLTPNESECKDGLLVVASAGQPSSDLASVELADLRNEVATLREQLRKLKSDQAAVQKPTAPGNPAPIADTLPFAKVFGGPA